jgi:hypothetical protein
VSLLRGVQIGGTLLSRSDNGEVGTDGKKIIWCYHVCVR